LGEESVRGILNSFGITEKESEVYIFLARHGVLKCGEIAKGMKRHTAQIYRVLKILQNKGLIEATLESPTRFTAVSFETIINLSIKAKQDEATQIEKTKKDVLDYWKNIGQSRLEDSPEKFVVIEGRNKIYPKIAQMIKDTKNQFSAISSVRSLLLADQFDVFDVANNHPSKSKIQFRFLTELSSQNVNAVKTLLSNAPAAELNFKGRNPNAGLKLSPQMVIKDNEETLFFMSPRTDTSASKEDVCLWTNCKTLVQAFTAVFEDLWNNSTEIEKKILELETGKPTPKSLIFNDEKTAQKKLQEIVHLAKKEILILTSSSGLLDLWKSAPFICNKVENGVSVKIMAPIVKQNFETAAKLSEFCEIRHVPTNYCETTIVDAKHLFQTNSRGLNPIDSEGTACFENIFYSDDLEYVETVKTALNEIWKSARSPSAVAVESIIRPYGPPVFPVPQDGLLAKTNDTIIDIRPPGSLTEKDVLNKIINAKRLVAENPAKDPSRMYASLAVASIHPPEYFKLPDILIWATHVDKHSSFGPEDYIVVYQRLEASNRSDFVPVAIAGDNPNSIPVLKMAYAGTPASQNHHLVKKDELEIRVHGNTLFAGWTVPIPLYPSDVTLPPACILIEGYGNVKTLGFSSILPSGFKFVIEENYFDSFVTFFHPASKYSGPGTDAAFSRDCIITNYPPPNRNVP